MTEKSGHNQHGKRGRHKKSTSRETQRWESEELIPARPPWMSQETYVKLAELRR